MARWLGMIGWVLSGALWIATAQAQTAGQVRKTAEASMLVSGEIGISPQGRVAAYTLDEQDKLLPEVVQLLGKAIPQWTFEPVERGGVAVAARSRMSLRLVARKVDEHYEMSVRSAQFTGEPRPGETVSKAQMAPPSYPEIAAKVHATGMVYLILQVGRDGKVAHADAEQTNLTSVADARTMKQLRTMFERSAVAAAQRWTFNPPTVGESVNDAFWVVRVPVMYEMRGQKPPAYGQWQSYIPGPRNPISWRQQQVAHDVGVDVGAGGELSQEGYGPTLKTPLGAS